MPAIAALGLGPAPLDDPRVYPGRTPAGSYLLVGSRLSWLMPADRPPPGWFVTHSNHEQAATPTTSRLEQALAAARTAPLHKRVPMVALGSNASPTQLMAKLTNQPCSDVLPVVQGTLRGIGLAFSAHVARPGYIPAAPVGTGDPQATTPVWVTLLDPDQMEVIDRTEPNYRPVAIRHPDRGWILRLHSGQQQARCVVYRSRHGVLDLPATAAPGQLITQAQLRSQLTHRFPSLPAYLTTQRSPDQQPGGTLATVEELARHGVVRADGLDRFLTPQTHPVDCQGQ